MRVPNVSVFLFFRYRVMLFSLYIDVSSTCNTSTLLFRIRVVIQIVYQFA